MDIEIREQKAALVRAVDEMLREPMVVRQVGNSVRGVPCRSSMLPRELRRPRYVRWGTHSRICDRSERRGGGCGKERPVG